MWNKTSHMGEEGTRWSRRTWAHLLQKHQNHNSWITIHIKMLEPTPKTSLHPKTKKKLWQDSRTGATAYKTKSHTHKVADPQTVKYITEVFPQKRKFWAPWQPWGLATGVEAPREPGDLKAFGLWFREFHRTCRNRNSTLGMCTQALMHIRTQGGKKQWPPKNLSQTHLLVLRVFHGGGVSCGSLLG